MSLQLSPCLVVAFGGGGAPAALTICAAFAASIGLFGTIEKLTLAIIEARQNLVKTGLSKGAEDNNDDGAKRCSDVGLHRIALAKRTLSRGVGVQPNGHGSVFADADGKLRLTEAGIRAMARV